MGKIIVIPKASLLLADIGLGYFSHFEALQMSGGTAPEAKQQPFLATITYAGIASDGAVGGTENIEGGPYKILIPPDLLAARAGDLIGKGVFAAQTLDTHDGSSRIGEWLDAYPQRIVGTEIHALRGGGLIDKRASDQVAEGFLAKILDRARNGELGFSYDLKDAPGHLEEVNGEKVLVLDDFKWRGATILRREAAAYGWTQLAAARVNSAIAAHTARPRSTSSAPAPAAAGNRQQSNTNSEDDMDEKKLKDMLDNLSAGLTTSLKKDITDSVAAALSPIDARLKALEAKATPIAGVTAAAADPAAAGGKVTVKDLLAGMTAAISASMKTAMKDALKEAGFQASTPGAGKRSTFSAASIETVKKYGALGEDDDPESPEAITQAIATVTASIQAGKMRKEAGGQIIGTLRAMKKEALARKEAN